MVTRLKKLYLSVYSFLSPVSIFHILTAHPTCRPNSSTISLKYRYSRAHNRALEYMTSPRMVIFNIRYEQIYVHISTFFVVFSWQPVLLRSALELSQYWYYLDTWLHHKVSITRSKTVNTKLFKQKSQFRQAVNVKQR
jgi:hypothetical protein